MSRLFVCRNNECWGYVFVVNDDEDKVSCPKCGKDNYLWEIITKNNKPK
jgi:hypothetical protein